MTSENTTALVLCGGGTQGAAEIGFYRALRERDIQPDFIVGTSVGAINGAFIASGFSDEELMQLWMDISQVNIYHWNYELLWKWGEATSLFKPTGLRQFLRERLPVDNFNQLEIPTTVVATDLQEASSVYLDEGPLLPVLMASCSLPVYFPPERIGGHQLVDGGLTNNIPVRKAYEMGADTIYCMLSECRHKLNTTVEGLFNMLVRSAQVNQYDRLRRDLRAIAEKADIYLLDLCITTKLTGFLDFSKTEMIIEEAYEFSKRALDQGYGCVPLPVESSS